MKEYVVKGNLIVPSVYPPDLRVAAATNRYAQLFEQLIDPYAESVAERQAKQLIDAASAELYKGWPTWIRKFAQLGEPSPTYDHILPEEEEARLKHALNRFALLNNYHSSEVERDLMQSNATQPSRTEWRHILKSPEVLKRFVQSEAMANALFNQGSQMAMLFEKRMVLLDHLSYLKFWDLKQRETFDWSEEFKTLQKYEADSRTFVQQLPQLPFVAKFLEVSPDQLEFLSQYHYRRFVAGHGSALEIPAWDTFPDGFDFDDASRVIGTVGLSHAFASLFADALPHDQLQETVAVHLRVSI